MLFLRFPGFSRARRNSSFSTFLTKVPGLYYIPRFVDPSTQASLLNSTLRLSTLLENSCQGRPSTAAHVPQPDFVRSAKHNLQSQEFYKSLTLADPSDPESTLR